jgi:hypothetical protein
MRRFDVSRAVLLACLSLAACGKPMPVSGFAATQPDFDPLTYWTGHTHSWGVVETPGGAPSEIVQTDCLGESEGPDGLHMRQTLTEGDGTVTHRDWHLRRLGGGHFTATANDMVGTAGPCLSLALGVGDAPGKSAAERHHVAMDVCHAGRHDDEPHDNFEARRDRCRGERAVQPRAVKKVDKASKSLGGPCRSPQTPRHS